MSRTKRSPAPIAGGRVNHQHYQIDGRERVRDDAHHPAIELIAGFVNARRVEKNYLPFGPRQNAADASARGLRLVGNDGYLFADEFIEQC